MDVTRKHSKNTTTLRLSGECTIYHAAAARCALLDDHKGFDKTVQLNLEQVSELDTAGVQLLLMLQREIGAAGGKLMLQASNETVDQIVGILHLPAPFQPLEAAR